eukprot:SAG11_NODE_16663_length_541_cov_0.785068_1_plen_114_part_10
MHLEHFLLDDLDQLLLSALASEGHGRCSVRMKHAVEDLRRMACAVKDYVDGVGKHSRSWVQVVGDARTLERQLCVALAQVVRQRHCRGILLVCECGVRSVGTAGWNSSNGIATA